LKGPAVPPQRDEDGAGKIWRRAIYKIKRGNKLFAVPGPLARRGKGGSPADGKKFVAERL